MGLEAEIFHVQPRYRCRRVKEPLVLTSQALPCLLVITVKVHLKDVTMLLVPFTWGLELSIAIYRTNLIRWKII